MGVKFFEPKYIILTAFKNPALHDHFVKNGVTQCYEKPLEIETLKSIFNALQDV